VGAERPGPGRDLRGDSGTKDTAGGRNTDAGTM